MIAFNSIIYFIFLVVVIVLYWRGNRKFQNGLLLGASLIFYGSWDWRFLVLLILSTTIDFGAARFIEHSRKAKDKKIALIISISSNLIILGFFKYYNFFADSLFVLLNRLGFGFENHLLIHVILPIGISFYTFQAIGYVVDVYKERIQAEKSWPLYLLYICFFPQLVAGPIEKADKMLGQFKNDRHFNGTQFMSGVDLILVGLIKKVVVADNIGYYTYLIFSLDKPSTLFLLLGGFIYAIQILADFSGYSDIARGSARLLGIDVMANFNHPYLSSSPIEFWKRWHISLSRFVRDYIYIPLGGSRVSTMRYILNMLITWIIMGLWHGASFLFILWGIYHGILSALTRLIGKISVGIKIERVVPRVAKIALTFFLVCIGWILFRAPDVNFIVKGLSQNAWMNSIKDFRAVAAIGMVGLIYALPLILLLVLRKYRPYYIHDIHHQNYVRIMLYACGIFLLLIAGGTSNDFIYFQF